MTQFQGLAQHCLCSECTFDVDMRWPVYRKHYWKV